MATFTPEPLLLDAITRAVEQRQPPGKTAVKRGDEILFLCPAHDDHEPSASWNPAKGVWHCHACAAGGGAKDLALLLGIEWVNGKVTIEKPSLDAFAADRCIDPAFLIDQFHLEPVIWRDGDRQRPAFRYPTPIEIDRIKFADGRKPKYVWARRGGGKHWYGLGGALNLLREQGGPLYIVNGEPSVWACHYRQVPAVCVCSGEGAPPTQKLARDLREMLERLAKTMQIEHTIPVMVVYDTDPTGSTGACKVVEVLRQAAIEEVAILDLSARLPDREGADVDDLQREVGVDLAVALAGLPPIASTPAAPVDDGLLPFCKPGLHPATDLGNAERLVALYGTRMRYCFERDGGSWLVYDGRRWCFDRTGQAMALAKLTARSIGAEAAAEVSDTRRHELQQWARSSESRARLRDLLVLAQDALAVTVDQLDSDPYLLNVANGTVDLRTGGLRQHNPADLITYIIPTEYHESAHRRDDHGSRQWRTFLEAVTANDDELIEYLQRAVGYSASGDPREDLVFFLHGKSRTGKSTFLRAVGVVFGEYAATTPSETFLAKKNSNPEGPQPELAKLQTRRFVRASETERGRSLAEAVVKMLTGGDTVSVRTLREKPVEWEPQFTAWLSSNYRPRIRDDAIGIWERLRVVPFEHPFLGDDCDAGLRKRLPVESAEAILSWIVEGSVLYHRDGLPVARTVESAIEQYKEAMDPLGEWMDECCTINPKNTTIAVSCETLRADYEAWTDHPVSREEFGRRLKRLGVDRKHLRLGPGDRRACYVGIRLKEPVSAESSDESNEQPGSGGSGGSSEVLTDKKSPKRLVGQLPLPDPPDPPDPNDLPMDWDPFAEA